MAGPWSSQVPDDAVLSSPEDDTESTVRLRLSDTPSPQSLSPQPTVTRKKNAFSTPSPLDSSTDLYGPDRSHIFTRLLARKPVARPQHVVRPSPSPAAVRFDESQLAMFAADNAARMPMSGLKDELAMAAGKVTPGVDDTPYIQYAIEALTRERGASPQEQHYSPKDAESYYRHLRRTQSAHAAASRDSAPVTTPGVVYNPTSPLPLPSPAFKHTSSIPDSQNRHYTAPPKIPASESPALSALIADAVGPESASSAHWVAVNKNMQQSLDPQGRTYPPLTYKPRILRPFSMMILMTLCLCMMAALIFCVEYSTRHSGLTPYPGSIYSAQYFLFRILPQLLGAVILVYAQSVFTTSIRMLPFVALADEDPRERYLALFQDMHVASLLLPQLVGPWQVKFFDVATWLAMFTVPLQSAAFTCVFTTGQWTWAPVQNVVWALVALYAVLVLATAVLMVYWFGRWTGLAWDIRSIGDLLPLLNRSNVMSSFGPQNLSYDGDEFKMDLRDRWFDRIGYWRAANTNAGGIWYSIGAVGVRGDDPYTLGGIRKDGSPKLSMDSEDAASPINWRMAYGRYLPFCLRTVPLLASTLVTGVLVVALLIVSFLPQTNIESGFRPLLAARPGNAAFSAANFLYSFVPSVIGMVFFMLFQSLDMALRRLQPWGDLVQLDGSPARKSLLADYACCLPLQASWRAARNGHWRLGLLSLMAQLFVFIPILAGGLFMALTTTTSGGDGNSHRGSLETAGDVRMFPSMPVFGVLLAFLLLYVGCLALAIPRRGQYELPRPVTSVAAIMSLCSAQELTQDAAFRSVRSRADLEGRLGVGGRDARDESKWFYGVVPGRDEHRVSVRRMQRFTEKRTATVRAVRAMV